MMYVLWYLCGLLAFFPARYEYVYLTRHAYSVERPRFWCASPAFYLFWLIASLLGPMLLFACNLILLMSWMDHPDKTDSWFLRPICRKK